MTEHPLDTLTARPGTTASALARWPPAEDTCWMEVVAPDAAVIRIRSPHDVRTLELEPPAGDAPWTVLGVRRADPHPQPRATGSPNVFRMAGACPSWRLPRAVAEAVHARQEVVLSLFGGPPAAFAFRSVGTCPIEVDGALLEVPTITLAPRGGEPAAITVVADSRFAVWVGTGRVSLWTRQIGRGAPPEATLVPPEEERLEDLRTGFVRALERLDSEIAAGFDEAWEELHARTEAVRDRLARFELALEDRSSPEHAAVRELAERHHGQPVDAATERRVADQLVTELVRVVESVEAVADGRLESIAEILVERLAAGIPSAER